MALVITSLLVQAALPTGTATVSPSTAEPMALLTSKKEGLRASMVFACAAPEAAKSSAARSADSREGTASFGRSRNGESQPEGKWHAPRPAAPPRAYR